MDDKILRQAIIDELDWDPSINSANIGVTANSGVVTLTGHVPTYTQKLAAEKATQRVKGVKGIAQEIEVRYAGAARTDEDIASQAVTTLNWDVVLPRDAIKVRVSKGWVTLTGEVEWDYQRRSAEADVRNLHGVVGILNNIAIKARVSPADVRKRIEDALQRQAQIEAKGVHFSIEEGKVKLNGEVGSLRERNAVERAVWAAPGVKTVEDRVRVG